jgi:hypothetical protein
MDWNELAQEDSLLGFCERRNEFFVSFRGRIYADHLSDFQLLKISVP